MTDEIIGAPTSAYSHMRLHRGQLSPEWQRVHDDMIKRGFRTAAMHMAQIVRFTRPKDYWAGISKQENNR